MLETEFAELGEAFGLVLPPAPEWLVNEVTWWSPFPHAAKQAQPSRIIRRVVLMVILEYSPDEGPLWLYSRVNIMSLMRNCWGGSR